MLDILKGEVININYTSNGEDMVGFIHDIYIRKIERRPYFNKHLYFINDIIGVYADNCKVNEYYPDILNVYLDGNLITEIVKTNGEPWEEIN